MRTFAAMLLGGLAAGALDITYAVLAYGAVGVEPLRIFQSVASGLLGRAAYEGGISTGALGACLHFAMTTGMAAGFVLGAWVLPVALQRPLLSGMVYGLLMFALMNYAVVPLSAAYPGSFPQGWFLAGALFAHTVLVGLPIAFIASWVMPRR